MEMDESESNHQILNLEANKELRFVIKNSEKAVSIELIDGAAEIFGINMRLNIIYRFVSSFAVSTNKGCGLKLTGNPSRSYTTNKSHIIDDLHQSLEEQRQQAEQNGIKGPITLIAGPTDVGKSTLSRSLLNYAARSGRKPLYIDLDVGQSSISVPGTIGILPIEGPGDVVKGFNDGQSSVYFFGYKSPGINLLLYYLLIDKLGETLHHRLRSSQDILHSGAIVDTCGWVTGGGYKSILLAAQSLRVNSLFVLADKRLHSHLKKDLPDVDIKFISKLNGVVERSRAVRSDRRDALIQEYFYGTTEFSIRPYTFDVKFSDVQMFRVFSSVTKVTFDMIDVANDFITLKPVSISNDLLNHVVAVSYADTVETALLTSVLGFICIIGVNLDNQTLSVLSPQPSPLPKHILLIGDIQLIQNKMSY